MAQLFLSLAGEGRGHATRARVLIEALRREHSLRIFAPADGHDFLAPLYAGTGVDLRPMPGPVFGYDRQGDVDYLATARANLGYTLRLNGLVSRLAAELREARPDLVIADFEPALPRAARRVGVPFVSLDHQHLLVTHEIPGLPPKARRMLPLLRTVVRAYHQGAAKTLVSSFHAGPLRQGVRDVATVGVLLRPEITASRFTHGDYLVAYFRKRAPEGVLDVLARSGRPVRIYGLGERADQGSLVFRPISERDFLDDLASCAAVVTTAGNQLIGEALSLQKPVLATPEPGNVEQVVNAALLEDSGCGRGLVEGGLDDATLTAFLNRLPAYREAAASRCFDGTRDVLAVIDEQLREERPIHPILAPAT
ncbi:MAG: glycosyltransferase family protein [Acidobacteriota bacterium]